MYSELTKTVSDEVGRVSIALPRLTHVNARVITGSQRLRLQLHAGVRLGTRRRQAVDAGLRRYGSGDAGM